MNTKRKIKTRKAVNFALIALFIWLIMSYAEICVKNTHLNPQYSKRNIIVSMINDLEGRRVK